MILMNDKAATFNQPFFESSLPTAEIMLPRRESPFANIIMAVG